LPLSAESKSLPLRDFPNPKPRRAAPAAMRFVSGEISQASITSVEKPKLMNPIRVLVARSFGLSAPLLMLALVSPAVAANGNYVLLSTVTEQDFAATGPGTDQTTTVTNNYDHHGNLLDTLIVNSGTFGQVQTTSFTNDRHGDPLSSVIEVNSDGASDPDGASDIDLTAITTFNYDAHGQRTGTDQEVYNDADELTIIRHTSYTYDSDDNLTSVETLSDIADINGIFDGIPNQVITVDNTWDSHHHLLGSVTTADFNGDGDTDDPGDSVDTRVNTFDRHGQLTGSVSMVDRMVGGVLVHSTATLTFTYGAHGLLTQVVTTIDGNNDGVIDQTNTSTNTWGHP
jgi:hypothetical protein